MNGRFFSLAAVLLLGAAAGCGSPSDEGASALARRAVKPEAAAYLTEAHRAMAHGDFGAALALADSAAAYAPELPDIPFLRGRIFTELNRLGEAQVAYEQTLALDPYFRGAWFKLGNNAFLQGQYREAVRLYEREQQLMHSSPKEVKALYRDVDREALPRVLLQIGRAYTLLGEADSARVVYQQSLAEDSSNAQAYAWLGELYEEGGELEQALAYAQRALKLEPNKADYLYMTGSLLNRTGRAEEAVPLLERALHQRPWHEGASYNLGQALLRLGRREAAQPYLARADTLQTLQAEVAAAQAAAYKQPDRPSRWTELGTLLLQAGRLEEARQAFSVAVYLNPANLALQNDLANLALAQGDTTGAVRRYQAILQQDSTFADVWLNLGVVYALSGHMGEAQRAWQKALQHEPDHAEAKAYLARLNQMR